MCMLHPKNSSVWSKRIFIGTHVWWLLYWTSPVLGQRKRRMDKLLCIQVVSQSVLHIVFNLSKIVTSSEDLRGYLLCGEIS